MQPNGRSVAAVFQDALEEVLGCRPDIKGCSRTDAGVHALGFMLNFHADTRIPAAKAAAGAEPASAPGHPGAGSAGGAGRFSTPAMRPNTKTYLYRIHNSPIDSPFAARYYTKVPGRLDADRMQQAAQYFVGKHDFLALCASGSSAAAHGDTVRTITACDVQRRGDDIDITVTADGYLYNMVRILAGTLCEAGAGRLAPEAVPGILASRDRKKRRADAGGERAFPQERGLRHAHRITQTRPMLPEGKRPFWEHCHCTKGQESMRKDSAAPRPVSDEPLRRDGSNTSSRPASGCATGASAARHSSSWR